MRRTQQGMTKEPCRRTSCKLHCMGWGGVAHSLGNFKEGISASFGMDSMHDYWFHAQDEPGAHVILKRNFSSQKVPRTSLEQGAIIAARSSWQKQASKAQVICAQVKNVRTIKGAAWGQVRVQQMEECLLVPMDESLEERLLIHIKNILKKYIEKSTLF